MCETTDMLDSISKFLDNLNDNILIQTLKDRGYAIVKDGEVDVRGASHLTGYSVETLRKEVQHNTIPHKRYGHRTVRFLPSELIAWKESIKKPSKYIPRPRSLR